MGQEFGNIVPPILLRLFHSALHYLSLVTTGVFAESSNKSTLLNITLCEREIEKNIKNVP